MKSEFVEVLGSKMRCLEEGSGDPIIFLHGVPTSSYLWRNVIPYVKSLGRCIAPDLIGMGKSDKPDIEYTIFDQIKYLDNFIETLDLKRLTLVMHGWGSVLGFNYAMNHEKNCKGLVFYESYLRTFNGDDLSLPYQEQLTLLQESEYMADIASNGTNFVDKVLPQGIMRPLSERDMTEYRRPYLQDGSGKALDQYVKEMPGVHGKKTAVDKIIGDYSKKLTNSDLPKLMLYSIPGFITTIATAMWAKDHLPNIELIEIGEELHYAQESNPSVMGETISVWLQGVEQN